MIFFSSITMYFRGANNSTIFHNHNKTEKILCQEHDSCPEKSENNQLLFLWSIYFQSSHSNNSINSSNDNSNWSDHRINNHGIDNSYHDYDNIWSCDLSFRDGFWNQIQLIFQLNCRREFSWCRSSRINEDYKNSRWSSSRKTNCSILFQSKESSEAANSSFPWNQSQHRQ